MTSKPKAYIRAVWTIRDKFLGMMLARTRHAILTDSDVITHFESGCRDIRTEYADRFDIAAGVSNVTVPENIADERARINALRQPQPRKG